MQIFVDADACPVVRIVEEIAEKYHIRTTLLCDNRIHWCIEEKLHLILQIRIQISKHDIVDIRPQMTYRCIKQMQIILNAYRLEPCTRRRIELRALATITHILKALLTRNVYRL